MYQGWSGAHLKTPLIAKGSRPHSSLLFVLLILFAFCFTSVIFHGRHSDSETPKVKEITVGEPEQSLLTDSGASKPSILPQTPVAFFTPYTGVIKYKKIPIASDKEAAVAGADNAIVPHNYQFSGEYDPKELGEYFDPYTGEIKTGAADTCANHKECDELGYKDQGSCDGDASGKCFWYNSAIKGDQCCCKTVSAYKPYLGCATQAVGSKVEGAKKGAAAVVEGAKKGVHALASMGEYVIRLLLKCVAAIQSVFVKIGFPPEANKIGFGNPVTAELEFVVPQRFQEKEEMEKKMDEMNKELQGGDGEVQPSGTFASIIKNAEKAVDWVLKKLGSILKTLMVKLQDILCDTQMQIWKIYFELEIEAAIALPHVVAGIWTRSTSEEPANCDIKDDKSLKITLQERMEKDESPKDDHTATKDDKDPPKDDDERSD